MLRLKRVVSFVVALGLILSTTVCAYAADAPATWATSMCVMDADSGRILYKNNETEERCIASITKIMTGILVIENNKDLYQTITVSATAAAEEGSSLYLAEGDKLSLRTALYGTMLRSGNDAAVAIAEFTAGDVKSFVKMMNQKAKELGMTHTHYSWPNGLIDEDNYSCARDMAILGRYAMQNKTFAEIVNTWYIETDDGYQIENHNKMLSRDKRCIGIKTGFTSAAGRTLVTCFKDADSDRKVIIVTLNDSNDYNDHLNMCDWAFENYQQKKLVAKKAAVATVTNDGKQASLVTENAVTWPAASGESSKITSSLKVQSNRGVPMKEGDVGGVLTFYSDGKTIGSTKLLYEKSVR